MKDNQDPSAGGVVPSPEPVQENVQAVNDSSQQIPKKEVDQGSSMIPPWKKGGTAISETAGLKGPQNQSGEVGVQEISSDEPGGIWYRSWASSIDGFILSIPFLLFFVVFGLTGRENFVYLLTNQTISLAAGLVMIILNIVYFVYMTAKSGATVGKKIFGINVVMTDTKKYPNMSQSAKRELVKFIPSFIPLFGAFYSLINGLVTLFSKEKLSIHDRVANTQVVVVNKPSKLKQFFIILALLLISGGFSLLPMIFIRQNPLIFNPMESAQMYDGSIDEAGGPNNIFDKRFECLQECSDKLKAGEIKTSEGISECTSLCNQMK